MSTVAYRQITFGTYSSFDDFGAYIGSEADTDTKIERAKPRTLRETIPFMNGSYNFSTLGGKIVYDDRIIRYTFIVSGTSRSDVESKITALDNWLGDVADTELFDTDFPGWKFINVSYNGMSAPQFYSINETKARVTAEFTAGPYMQTISGVLKDITTFIPNMAATRYLYDMFGTAAAAGAVGWLVRMPTLVGSSFIYEQSISVGAYSANVTISSRDSRWWLAFPKTYNNADYTVSRSSNCDIIDNGNYWIIRALGTTITIIISAMTGHGPESGATCKQAILNATWRKSDSYDSWPNSSVPSMHHLRIISEGEPAIAINGDYADISSFALAVGDLMLVSNSKSVACKLQYCTVQERR